MDGHQLVQQRAVAESSFTPGLSLTPFPSEDRRGADLDLVCYFGERQPRATPDAASSPGSG